MHQIIMKKYIMILYIIIFFKVPNLNIRMISEGPCDTEDWSNGCWKISFAITKFLKYI